MQSQLFFDDVEWSGRPVDDDVEDLYRFLQDAMPEGAADAGLPTAVLTILSKCYSTTCEGDRPCYSVFCPYKGTAPPTDERLVDEEEPEVAPRASI